MGCNESEGEEEWESGIREERRIRGKCMGWRERGMQGVEVRNRSEGERDAGSRGEE